MARPPPTPPQCTVESGSALESGLVDPGGAGSCGTESVTEPVTETEGGDSLTLLSLDAPIAQTYGSYGSCQVARGTGYHHCNPPVVPLPPSSLLLVSGALALLILGRRRRLATA